MPCVWMYVQPKTVKLQRRGFTAFIRRFRVETPKVSPFFMFCFWVYLKTHGMTSSEGFCVA